MSKKYLIRLDGQYIGFTHFEFGDPPMGVVMGRIYFEGVDSPYRLISEYCRKHSVPTNEDDPLYEAIFTQTIPGLTISGENGEDIEGIGATIQGLKEEGYQIDVIGIPYEIYDREFNHHRETYENQFK